MPSTKLVIGGAAAGAAIGVRVARSLYGRWRLLPPADRERIAAFARGHQGEGAVPAGRDDRERAEADLRASNETLAAALVETAESDPELGPEDVQRDCASDLRRELRAPARPPTLRLREAGANAPSRLSRIRAPLAGTLLVQNSDSAHTSGPSARPQAATLEFREATKRYPGQDEPAVDRLSLTVPAGEICVLVGPSGCGKTTAMRMVNRMIDITAGDILLDGQSVRERSRRSCGARSATRSSRSGLFPHLSVADNIGTVPRLLGWDRERIRARVDELLELVSLDPAETRDRYPAQLSGGQRQRVGVARALAVDPPLMLMDEPFGAIDPINRERLQNEFLRLQREIRKTVVFVTHDIDEAIKMGDHIAMHAEGRPPDAVRAARRAADAAREPVRGGLRGRRPRAQAARPPARARRGPVEGAAGAGG